MKFNAKIDFQKIKNINPKYIFQVRRYMLIAVILAVTSFSLLGYVLLAQLPQVIQVHNDMKTEEEKLEQLRQKAASLQDTSFIDQEGNRQRIDILLPSKKPLLQLLNNTGKAADDAGVTLASIETSPGRIASGSAQLQSAVSQFDFSAPGTKINGIDVLTIGLSVNGTLPQLNAFFKKIEQITPISDIIQLQLNSQSSSPNPDFYEAKMRIASYYFTQRIAVAVDTPLPLIPGNQQDFLKNLDNFEFNAETQQPTIQGGGLNDLFKISQ
jgi:hypothetical protein